MGPRSLLYTEAWLASFFLFLIFRLKNLGVSYIQILLWPRTQPFISSPPNTLHYGLNVSPQIHRLKP